MCGCRVGAHIDDTAFDSAGVEFTNSWFELNAT